MAKLAKQKSIKHKKSRRSSTYPPIAVTGHGYKGMTLLRWLEDDPRFQHIIFLDIEKPKMRLKKTRFVRFDLTETLADAQLADILSKESIDTFIHTALPVTPPRNMAWAHELLSVGSMYICNAASAAKVRKLILPSTADVYGAFPDNPNYMTEEHAARGYRMSKFLADKIDAENQFLKFSRKHPERVVTILRPCTILGPTIRSYKTRYLSNIFVPTVLGYDPLVQFIHENDFFFAQRLVIEQDCPGIFNLASRGVIPLSKAIRLMGKIPLPLSLFGLKTLVQGLWYLDISPAPAAHLEFLKYMCVVAIEKAEREIGFVPRYSCKDPLLDFVQAERLREVNLAEEWNP